LELSRGGETVENRGGRRRWKQEKGDAHPRARPLPPSTVLYPLLPSMTADERQAILRRACDLFNAGEYWLAHEALETVWRSIISDGDEAAARVWQGLIQAAAALLHRERGNRHGVVVVGGAALEKTGGP